MNSGTFKIMLKSSTNAAVKYSSADSRGVSSALKDTQKQLNLLDLLLYF